MVRTLFFAKARKYFSHDLVLIYLGSKLVERYSGYLGIFLERSEEAASNFQIVYDNMGDVRRAGR